ncbi:MAG: hypothetical protein ACUVWR_02580 [Anaerolineae bacterium]
MKAKTLLAWVLLGVAAICLSLLFSAAGRAGAEPSAPRPTPTSLPEVDIGAQGGLSASANTYANLVIESIEVSPQVPLVGQTATIRVAVANLGLGYPTDSQGRPANFWVDLFVDAPVTGPEDLASMPAFPPALSVGLQASWLPPGGSYTVSLNYTFTESSMHDLYAVVDIAELQHPIGNVDEGGASGESDNILGPYAIEARYPNIILAKDNSDYSRGPASSLAIVAVPTAVPGQTMGEQALTFGDASLNLGFFAEPPRQWGITDPLSPDYNMQSLDTLLNETSGDRPQEWPRLAAKEGLLVAVWQDRRNSALTDWDIYMSWSSDQGETWQMPNLRVNDDTIGTGDQRRPAVAISPVDGDNRVLVVWQDNRSGKYRIMGQWYNWTGTSLALSGANFTISTASDVNSLSPDVTAGPEGNFYVVWQDDHAGNTDIWLRGHTVLLGWMAQPRRISDDPQRSNQRAPRVSAGRTQILQDYRTLYCIDGAIPVFELLVVEVDPILVVWEDDRVGDSDVHMTYSIDQAQTFAVDVRVNDDPVGNGVAQRQPVTGVAEMWQERELADKDGVCAVPGASAIVKIPTAAFYYAWQDFRNSNNAEKDNNPDIYLSVTAATSSAGSLLDLLPSENERLNPEESEPIWQEYPAIACRTYDGSLFEDTMSRHNAFIVWADERNYGSDNTDIYMAVRGDGGRTLSSIWVGGIIQVNSGAHATNTLGSEYLQYAAGDPPPARQTHPSVAADITRALTEPEDLDIWWHKGFVYVSWDDNRVGGIDRDVYFTRSNMTYLADYSFYPDPSAAGQLDVGGTCRYGSGSYVSPVYDAGLPTVTWDRVEWNAITPMGTFITLQTRVGNDPNNLGQWLPKTFPYAKVGLPNLGAPLQGYDTPGQFIVGGDGQAGPTGRYIQYRVNMWAWPLGGPVANACGVPGESPERVYDPVASSPILYSVTLHYRGGLQSTILPLVMSGFKGQ